MKPLQQKFLKAIEDNIDNIGYGDIAINYKGAAKASEQICIEEKIELLNGLKQSYWYEERFGNVIPLETIDNKISQLQTQLNKLNNGR